MPGLTACPWSEALSQAHVARPSIVQVSSWNTTTQKPSLPPFSWQANLLISPRARITASELRGRVSKPDTVPTMSNNLPQLRVAVVGATGMVGRTMLKVLEKRGFPVGTLIPVASARSVGKQVEFSGEHVEVVDLDTALAQKPHVALFSAGGALSLEWAPKFAAAGTTVVDNSSAWRMSDDHKLVVPEVNGDVVGAEDLILANPNCTTMQLVMCLKPIHDKWGIDRGVVSTYQSVTGTGQAAVDQLNGERAGLDPERVYPHAIDQNCLPHCDVFLDNGYTKEEMKVHQETKKILGDPSIGLSCTAVRVPVLGGSQRVGVFGTGERRGFGRGARCVVGVPGRGCARRPARQRLPHAPPCPRGG